LNLNGAAVISGNDIQTVSGNFKIGSFDGTTVGAQFAFRYLGFTNQRITSMEANQLYQFTRQAMLDCGLTV
jgi:hypothetical protein